MRSGRWLLITGVVLVLLSIAGFLVKGRFQPTTAGVHIETEPQATVFVDGEQKGNTPYETTLLAGEYLIKLVPIAENGALAPYDTKLTLVPGIQTVVRRFFGPTDAESSGEVISFERLPGKSTSLAVVSSPDAASVAVDGRPVGFAPHRSDSISAGEHAIKVSAPGYEERSIMARAYEGYKLTVVAKLAKIPGAEREQQKEEPKVVEEKIKILSTPTGWLRVRSEPSLAGSEVTKVDAGGEFAYLDQNEDGSWFKIEYEQDKEGWVSAQYAEKVTQEE